MKWLTRWLFGEPDPWLVAFDQQSAELLEAIRRYPERAAALGRALRASGMTAEEAARAFGRLATLSSAEACRP